VRAGGGRCRSYSTSHHFHSEKPCCIRSSNRRLGGPFWVSQSSESGANVFQLRLGLRSVL
jgi:hypothetical protein